MIVSLFVHIIHTYIYLYVYIFIFVRPLRARIPAFDIQTYQISAETLKIQLG